MAKQLTKLELLYHSFKNELYRDRDWVLSILSMTQFADKKKELVVHREPTYVYFIADGEECIISDAKVNEPLFNIKDKVEVLFGLLSNIEKPTVTTVGNLLFNACIVDFAFGKKLGYLNDKKTASIKYIEGEVAKRMVDGHSSLYPNEKTAIYYDEYLRFIEGCDYLQCFNFLWTVCVTPRLLTVPPNNAALKKELVTEAADDLGKPATLAHIYNKLDLNDAAFMKDDISSSFVNGKVKVARRKMFLMQGGEAGLTGGDTFDVATNSLAEGLEVSKWATYNNSLRAGSLNRGHETQLGGVATKEMIRATSNIKIVKGDCGTKMGRVVTITEENKDRQLIGLAVQTKTGPIFVKNKEEAGKYLGQTVIRRSPQFCHADGENFCEYCVGLRLSAHPTGVSMAITEIGGVILGIFMSMMHAKELKVHKLKFSDIIQ
jgi:hypothetical protein